MDQTRFAHYALVIGSRDLCLEAKPCFPVAKLTRRRHRPPHAGQIWGEPPLPLTHPLEGPECGSPSIARLGDGHPGSIVTSATGTIRSSEEPGCASPSPLERCPEAAASRGDNSVAWFKAELKFLCWQIWGRVLRASVFSPRAV